MTATRSDPRDRPRLAEIGDLPPSAKLVYLALYYEAEDGEMTQTEIAEMLQLSQRTVRFGASRLLDETDTIRRLDNATDARETVYELVDRS